MIKNKKGFAISIILYAIVILAIGILYIMLSINKSRFKVNERLQNDVEKGIIESKVTINCLWEESFNRKDVFTCTPSEQKIDPEVGEEYVTCDEKHTGLYRYVRSSATCANSSTIPEYASDYQYTSSALALNACNGIKGSACSYAQGGVLSGATCTTEERIIYDEVHYTYRCY